MKICRNCQETFASSDWQCPACGFAPAATGGFVSCVPGTAGSGEGFREDAFAELATLEAGHFWFRARNRLIVWALRRYFPQFRSLLELGCGTGFVLTGIARAFPGRALTGSDPFAAALAIARERLPGTELCRIDARAIPFAYEFDVIGAFDVLEHIADDGQVLQEVHRALRPGGGLLLTVPQHPWLWSRADAQASHVCRYRAGELRCRVEAAGFEILCVTSFVSWLLPLMALVRGIERLRPAATSTPPAGFALPAPVNRLLELLLDLERGTITAGLSYPLGGSLLLVARKK